MQALLDQIDWTAPWLVPYREFSKPLIRSVDFRETLTFEAVKRGILTSTGKPIQFVEQNTLPPNTAYESFVHETGCVPTRDNLHDFFNGLVWLAFPEIKKRLNALQAQKIRQDQITPPLGQIGRGRLRDKITLFDESGALVVVHPGNASTSLQTQIRDHCWHDVFIKDRQSYGREWSVLLIGHSLIEKLVRPYKSITAQIIFINADDYQLAADQISSCSLVDERAALWLDSERNKVLYLTPLPIAGIPSWWLGQTKIFYDDVHVFRPKTK